MLLFRAGRVSTQLSGPGSYHGETTCLQPSGPDKVRQATLQSEQTRYGRRRIRGPRCIDSQDGIHGCQPTRLNWSRMLSRSKSRIPAHTEAAASSRWSGPTLPDFLDLLPEQRTILCVGCLIIDTELDQPCRSVFVRRIESAVPSGSIDHARRGAGPTAIAPTRRWQ